MNIRPETPADRLSIHSLNTDAFGQPAEANLVDLLRAGPTFIPGLSLVAESSNGALIGHILFTRIHIDCDNGGTFPCLALAPMAVHPAYQGRGVGSALVEAGLRIARLEAQARETPAVIVLGHPEYYPRFGFQPASRWGIRCPYPAPDEAFMALELVPGGLDGVGGMVVYPGVFNEV